MLPDGKKEATLMKNETEREENSNNRGKDSRKGVIERAGRHTKATWGERYIGGEGEEGKTVGVNGMGNQKKSGSGEPEGPSLLAQIERNLLKNDNSRKRPSVEEGGKKDLLASNGKGTRENGAPSG